MATDPLVSEAHSGKTVLLLNLGGSERSSAIHASTLFAHLSPGEIREVLANARPKVFDRNDVLFMQGQPARQLMLIVSGSVKLTQLSTGGSEVILWLCGVGDSVGLSGIDRDSVYTCTARVVVPCRALVWDWTRLEILLQQHPQVRMNMVTILGQRLVELEERFREIATEKVARRVALALLRTMRQVGRGSAAGVHVSLSREELAQLTGTTLFSISRLMSKWSADGIVRPGRETVLVLDVKRLSLVSEEPD